MVQHPVEEVWRVWIKNFQVTMPLMAPQLYVSVDYLDGPPLAPGGVFLIKHNPASFPHFDSIKAKWIVMDHDNCYFKAAILEGGHLGEHSTVANLTYSCKLVPGPTPNTCIKKWIFEFDESTQHDFLDYLKEEMSILGSSTCSHIASKA
ncbi:hypothetical protein GOP47_0023815 [Adiantum capillus-veneris]|uniref:Bet v I/Major latex protein domain-containing protein n=2 Tax=Adiantum capillus-veneris TaxID=13818 RepID=A0A9D4U4P6_ADICA|nr:hypothetical protein GOP47_0023815 [Adiantum capillus-veneris]